ncbi:MAG: ROK family protein, partial [Aristaeellaceae bacterium]
MDKFFFGVDIGGTATKLGAFSAEGKLLDKWEIPTDTSESGSRIMPNIAAEIIRYAHATENVVAVGVGVPGPVRRDGYVKRCVNLGWGGFNPARDL